MKVPKAFISYSWDDDLHKDWVRELAARLRGDGIETVLDQWELAPGDRLPVFMETAVRESDFVLIVCTPRYKERSEKRSGGVGYEGDIMTGEVLTKQNHRKFIPILRMGTWDAAAPGWLASKYYVDLSGISYSEAAYADLLLTLRGERASAPPVQKVPTKKSSPVFAIAGGGDAEEDVVLPPFEPIKIKGIIVDDVGEPRNDGTRGSALYRVPFQLSATPPYEWAEIFRHSWDRPPRWTTMHRPGIGSVIGDRIILDGTTVEEVKNVHRETLVLAVNETNERYREWTAKRNREIQARNRERRSHRDTVADIAGKIRFDEDDD